jgi:hypothetical protein
MSDPFSVQRVRILDDVGAHDEELTAPFIRGLRSQPRVISRSIASRVQLILAGTLSAQLFCRLNVIFRWTRLWRAWHVVAA